MERKRASGLGVRRYEGKEPELAWVPTVDGPSETASSVLLCGKTTLSVLACGMKEGVFATIHAGQAPVQTDWDLGGIKFLRP